MSMEDQIKRAISTGKVEFGVKSAEKALLLGTAKRVFISKDLQTSDKERLQFLIGLAKIPNVEVERTYKEFGASLGRDHPIGALVVLDEGKANFNEVLTAKEPAPKQKKASKAKKAKKDDADKEEEN